MFFYSPDRKGEWPVSHLKDFSGVLHADGYAGFKGLYERGRIVEAACWAHVRRKFFDVYSANGSPVAEETLDRTGALYGVEAAINGMAPDERHRRRQAQSKPIASSQAFCGGDRTELSGRSELQEAPYSCFYMCDSTARLRPLPKLDTVVVYRGPLLLSAIPLSLHVRRADRS
jgi:hypothetical protein